MIARLPTVGYRANPFGLASRVDVENASDFRNLFRISYFLQEISVADAKLLSIAAGQSCLRRNVTTEEVGNTAAFLLSDLSSGITGEITYVDAGFSINSMNVPDA